MEECSLPRWAPKTTIDFLIFFLDFHIKCRLIYKNLKLRSGGKGQYGFNNLPSKTYWKPDIAFKQFLSTSHVNPWKSFK